MSEAVGTLSPSQMWRPQYVPFGFNTEMGSRPPAPLPVGEAIGQQIGARGSDLAKYIRVVGQDTGVTTTGSKEVIVHVPLRQEDIDGAVQAGRLPKTARRQHFFRVEEAAKLGFPGVFPGQETEALAKALQYELHNRHSDAWAQLPSGMIARQQRLQQIIRFSAFDFSVSLYNFSGSRLSGNQTDKIANGIRAVCDATGGGILQRLKVMAIVRSDDPFIYHDLPGCNEKQVAHGRVYRGAAVFSEGLINRTAELVRPVQSWRQGLATIARPSEPDHVPGDKLQLTVVHELSHVVALDGAQDGEAIEEYGRATGWEWTDVYVQGQRVPKQRGQPMNPVLYGRVNDCEDAAVTAEAEFAGGKLWEQYDDSRRSALQRIWTLRHSGLQGPAFVRATEEPLMPPHLRVASGQPVTILPRYAYRVIPPDPIAQGRTRVK